jgi:NAD(P)-dependent dehydrogenase (short-subunit alcohol dehydrogenase family)
MRPLGGRVAVVTGGGRGIGRAIAQRFAQEGASVVVSSRTASDLDRVVGDVKELGVDGLAVVADVMDRDTARQPVVECIERFGRVDVLVNNVGGVIGRNDIFGSDDGSFEATLVLNLTSAWWATTAALPSMRDHGFGRVLNIGSGESGHAGGPAGYVAAKHGLAGITKQLAYEAGGLGITVNCICPGWTNTSMIDWERSARARGISAQQARDEAARTSRQNRILEPEEIAAMAAFLASPEGTGVNGQIIYVDGGYKL